MFGSVGIPEILAMLIVLVLSVLPILVAVWAVVVLQRIRTSQQAIHDRLTAIEQALQRR